MIKKIFDGLPKKIDSIPSVDKISNKSRHFMEKYKVEKTSPETTSRVQRFKTELKGTLFGFKKPAGDGGGKEAPQEPGQFNVKNDGKFEFKKATRPAGDGGGEEAPLDPGEADKRKVRSNFENNEKFEFKKGSPPAQHGVNGSSAGSNEKQFVEDLDRPADEFKTAERDAAASTNSVKTFSDLDKLLGTSEDEAGTGESDWRLPSSVEMVKLNPPGTSDHGDEYDMSEPDFDVSPSQRDDIWGYLTPPAKASVKQSEASRAPGGASSSSGTVPSPEANAAGAARKAVPPSLAEINKYYLDQNAYRAMAWGGLAHGYVENGQKVDFSVSNTLDSLKSILDDARRTQVSASNVAKIKQIELMTRRLEFALRNVRKEFADDPSDIKLKSMIPFLEGAIAQAGKLKAAIEAM